MAVPMERQDMKEDGPASKRPRVRAPALAPHLLGKMTPGGSGGAAGSTGSKVAAEADGGLFSGLPEAASSTCAPKDAQKIAETKAKPLTHVRALHLLKKHSKSRRPSSWREKVITRSLEEATHSLKELRKKLVACESKDKLRAEFERLARKESDCSSAKEGGSLGKFGRGQMQPAFESAAFGLAVNELSGVVVTDSGVHLILRLE